MLDEVLESSDHLGLPQWPEILTGDAGYGATGLIVNLMDRGIAPHVSLLADEAPSMCCTGSAGPSVWSASEPARERKEVQRRNRVREIHRTCGYTV